MEIEQIDFYINKDHMDSSFPPIFVEKSIINEFDDLDSCFRFAKERLIVFRKAYSLPDAVTMIHFTE